jgi:hypothetical protein
MNKKIEKKYNPNFKKPLIFTIILLSIKKYI